MRNFLIAFFGTVGLAVVGVPIAVHESRQAGHTPAQVDVVLPVGLVPVTTVNESDQSADRADEGEAQTNREQTASTPREKDSSNETSEPRRPASGRQGSSGRGGQKTINVDLSDLVIRPV